jgi:hypothetical protein
VVGYVFCPLEQATVAVDQMWGKKIYWKNILPNIKNDIGFQVHKIFLPFLVNQNHAFHLEKLIKFVLMKYNSVQSILKSAQC